MAHHRRRRSLHEVETSPDGRYIRFDEKLGSGAYKEVWLCYDTETGQECAWNCVALGGLPEHEQQRIRGETAILKALHHPAIISFGSTWENFDKQEICFTTSIVTSGTLKSYISRVKGIKLKVIKNWCRQILGALNYLHCSSPPIIHRDLKCDNIFMNGSTGEVILGDFGLARARHATTVESVLGTPEFIAPELYEQSYTESVDVYAFGMCMLEMITKEYPFEECNNAAQIWRKVSSGAKPAVLQRIGWPEVRMFIEICISDHRTRPSARELLQHPFLVMTSSNPMHDDNVCPVSPRDGVTAPAATSPNTAAPTPSNANTSVSVSTNHHRNADKQIPHLPVDPSPISRQYQQQLSKIPVHIPAEIPMYPSHSNPLPPLSIPNTPASILPVVSSVSPPPPVQSQPSLSRIQSAQASPVAVNSLVPGVVVSPHGVPREQSSFTFQQPQGAQRTSGVGLAGAARPPGINTSVKPPPSVPSSVTQSMPVSMAPASTSTPMIHPAQTPTSNPSHSQSRPPHMQSPVTTAHAATPASSAHSQSFASHTPSSSPSASTVNAFTITVEVVTITGPSASVVLHYVFDTKRKKQIKFAFDFRSDSSWAVAVEMVKVLHLGDAQTMAIAAELEHTIDPYRKAFFDEQRRAAQQQQQLPSQLQPTTVTQAPVTSQPLSLLQQPPAQSPSVYQSQHQAAAQPQHLSQPLSQQPPPQLHPQHYPLQSSQSVPQIAVTAQSQQSQPRTSAHPASRLPPPLQHVHSMQALSTASLTQSPSLSASSRSPPPSVSRRNTLPSPSTLSSAINATVPHHHHGNYATMPAPMPRSPPTGGNASLSARPPLPANPPPIINPAQSPPHLQPHPQPVRKLTAPTLPAPLLKHGIDPNDDTMDICPLPRSSSAQVFTNDTKISDNIDHSITKQSLSSYSVTKLKELIRARGGTSRLTDCIEKSDLIQCLLELMGHSLSRQSTSPTTSPGNPNHPQSQRIAPSSQHASKPGSPDLSPLPVVVNYINPQHMRVDSDPFASLMTGHHMLGSNGNRALFDPQSPPSARSPPQGQSPLTLNGASRQTDPLSPTLRHSHIVHQSQRQNVNSVAASLASSSPPGPVTEKRSVSQSAAGNGISHRHASQPVDPHSPPMSNHSDPFNFCWPDDYSADNDKHSNYQLPAITAHAFNLASLMGAAGGAEKNTEPKKAAQPRNDITPW